MPGPSSGPPARPRPPTTSPSCRWSAAGGRSGTSSILRTPTGTTSDPGNRLMTAIPVPQSTPSWTLPRRGPVGILLFILAESALFSVFVAAYLYYIGHSLSGPTPREVLQFPVLMTVCLLSSSLTVHLAGRALAIGATVRFLGYWLATILLGAAFLAGT